MQPSSSGVRQEQENVGQGLSLGRLQSVAVEYTVPIMWRVSNSSARHQEQVEHFGFNRNYDATMNIIALKLGLRFLRVYGARKQSCNRYKYFSKIYWL